MICYLLGVAGHAGSIVVGILSPQSVIRKAFISIRVILQAQPDLLEVVVALATARRLTGRLNSGNQEGEQERDDGDDDEQFDKRETAGRVSAARPRPPSVVGCVAVMAESSIHTAMVTSSAQEQAKRRRSISQREREATARRSALATLASRANTSARCASSRPPSGRLPAGCDPTIANSRSADVRTRKVACPMLPWLRHHS